MWNPKKTCTMCGKTLPVSSFYKDSRGKYGVRAKCKPCFSTFSNTVNREKPQLFLSRAYCGMRCRVEGVSTERNKKYYLGLSILSKKKFIRAGLINKMFIRLHKAYVASGFKQALCPSVDRIDSSKGYVQGNIRWLTWKENCHLGSLENARRWKNAVC